MCTITFIPRNDEYLLAMNRDDLFTRASALPIVRVAFGLHAAAYPQEQGGGTWIGVNQHGNAFGLLNWAVPPKGTKEKSRGTVVPQMVVSTGLEQARMVFDGFEPAGVYPFRLIGIFPSDRAIYEWHWDGEDRSEQSIEWGARHWFSSGASDEEAERTRGAVCDRFWRDERAGTREWLRRLHASHEPEQGVFSICAHRSAGGTLSYTEIEVSKREVLLAYSPVSPCRGVDFADHVIMPRVAQRVASSEALCGG